MHTKPLITIITVVYNGSRDLEDTIRSVTALAYPNLAYIVIDGGSTDGTVDVIRKHAGAISYWVSEKDNGIYDAMNKGWAACKSHSFILFLGAGDRIVSLPAEMERYGCRDVVYGKVLLGGDKSFRPNAGWQLRVRNTLHHQALLVNKAAHPGNPFDVRFKLFADFDFNQRLFNSGIKFSYDDSFVGYAMPDGASSRYDLAEALTITRKNFGLCWSFYALCYFLARRTFVETRALVASFFRTAA